MRERGDENDNDDDERRILIGELIRGVKYILSLCSLAARPGGTKSNKTIRQRKRKGVRGTQLNKLRCVSFFYFVFIFMCYCVLCEYR